MKMAATLPCEVNKFCSHTKRLRHILDETRHCFAEINARGKFEGMQLVSAEMLQEEESEIMSAVEKPPCIVVFGQSLYAKATIVNLIFGKRIIPIISREESESCSFRTVRFKHGHNPSLSLTLPDDYDLLDTLEAYNGPWQCVPRADLELKPHERSDPASASAVLEVRLNHPLLRNGCQVVMSPCNHIGDAQEVVRLCVTGVSPIVLYAFFTDELTQVDTEELQILRQILAPKPVMFVRVTVNDKDISENPHLYSGNRHSSKSRNKTNRLKYNASRSNSNTSASNPFDNPQKVILRTSRSSSLCVFQQLCNLGYLSVVPSENSILNHLSRDYYTVESDFCENLEQFPSAILLFVRHVVQSYLINASTVLNHAHNRCLQMFILTAYDMQREMQITPKKIEFARTKEQVLYRSLLEVAISKHDEIRGIITDSMVGMREILLAKAAHHRWRGVIVPSDAEVQSAQDLKTCTSQIQELVVSSLNQAIAGKLVSSINILRDTYTGTLTRCLESLEKSDSDSSDSSNSSSSSSSGSSATDALKQILNTAYQVEISTHSGSSLIRSLIEKMKQLIQAMPWKTPPKVDSEWRQRVASDMLDSLKASKLAKSLSSQIKDRLNKSHDAFGAALKQLELRHCGRLDRLEDERMKVRKVYAPKVAKLALESTSLRDLILNGMPQMGREIGRGQYGVVYSCDTWATRSPCAIKSVVPPDDKHWNDLALEFYYTKHVPPHDRVVSLHGSVIDYMYGGGTSPAVLLIMDRFQRDLYGAIKQGIDWLSRLQVAIDVVEGIRFLHSQGLVHRDIKLKNVMLDSENRGKITDLGFCKPEAMMSGSVVGTPIHMAPELFTGKYDASVDVYAFGILFWYVCSGHVRLPSSFEQCANKDQLWQNVKRGLRPERLPQFDEECWLLMNACWNCDMAQRPLLGNVEAQLHSIAARFGKSAGPLTSLDGRTPSGRLTVKNIRPLLESV